MLSVRASIIAAFALITTALASPAVKAAGDAEKAKGLIAEHCSECHAVPGYNAEGLPTLEAPSFQAIADDPATYTEARLRAYLLQPHWPMGQFQLSSSNIDNIIAYIRSLGGE